MNLKEQLLKIRELLIKRNLRDVEKKQTKNNREHARVIGDDLTEEDIQEMLNQMQELEVKGSPVAIILKLKYLKLQVFL